MSYDLKSIQLGNEKYMLLVDNLDFIMDIEAMQELVIELEKTIDYSNNMDLDKFIKSYNIETELKNLGNSTSSHYPLSFLNMNKKKMTASNMRKSNRPYKCLTCGKDFYVKESEFRYYINPYLHYATDLVDFSNIDETISGSCCTKKCLAVIAKDIAIKSINPKIFKNIDFGKIEKDIFNIVDVL